MRWLILTCLATATMVSLAMATMVSLAMAMAMASAWLRLLRRTACRSWPVQLRVVTHRHLATIQLRTRRAKTRRVRYVWVVADFFCVPAMSALAQSGHGPLPGIQPSRKLVQDHLTLKTERLAKIIKVATINTANTRIVRCSALGMVNWSAIASSTPGKI